jgi:hypothetical protein
MPLGEERRTPKYLMFKGGETAMMFALKRSDASPNSRKEERMQLNIYALAKIAIMTDSLHAGREWSEGRGR